VHRYIEEKETRRRKRGEGEKKKHVKEEKLIGMRQHN